MSSLLPEFSINSSVLPPVITVYDFISAAEISEWTANAVALGTVAASGTNGGAARISGAATTDDSGNQIQLVNCAVLASVSTQLEFDVPFRLSNAAQPFLIGWAVVDTSLIASAPTDGIYFSKAKGSTAVSFVVRRGSSSVTVTLPGVTIAAATDYRLGAKIRFDGDDPLKAEITVYFNGDPIAFQVFTSTPSDATLVPSIAAQSGSAVGTQTADFDWWRSKWTRRSNI